MKSNLIFTTLLLIGLQFTAAQSNEEDINTLSIFSEYAKAKNYDAAYEPWMAIRQRNPKFNRAIFTYGEKILNHKIKTSEAEAQVSYIHDLVKLWRERAIHFPKYTPKGKYMAKSSQLQYDYRNELQLTKSYLFNCFDAAYQTDLKSFTNPKSLYTYFSLMVDLYDDSQKTAQELFNKFDDISEKLNFEIKNYTQKRNAFMGADGTPIELTSKQVKMLKSYNSYLNAYDKIASSINTKLGSRANCENLVPLYTRDFETYKNDGVWLQRAMNKMFAKGCNDEPLFVQIVEQKNALDPNATTAFYLGFLMEKSGKSSEALNYYEQAVSLETDDFDKAKILYKIASNFKSKKRYSQARNYYGKALRYNPSLGKAHLAIATMYAASANSCGEDNFSKRAVYWLAAKEARKAGRLDPNIKKAAAKSIANFEAKAPTKSEIFSSARAGQTIQVGCWIQRSVKVPEL